jgi:hypothetical protein
MRATISVPIAYPCKDGNPRQDLSLTTMQFANQRATRCHRRVEVFVTVQEAKVL